MTDAVTEAAPDALPAPEAPGPFAALRAQINGLRDSPALGAGPGHCDLAADLWLSTDPAGTARVAFHPAEVSLALRIEQGDSGAWAALGMRLPVADLVRGRYLALRLAVAGGEVASFTPALRYYLPEGMRDAPGRLVVLPGGPREELVWLPLDRALLDRASGCELNLFFHTDSVILELAALEPLMMV